MTWKRAFRHKEEYKNRKNNTSKETEKNVYEKIISILPDPIYGVGLGISPNADSNRYRYLQ
ncbi:hypothetical protein Tsumi_00890 [Porphyromonas miyakawae]|uniref:Uncharacterized protein n=1 Tax=Porphyromonas miyakawae TaxID=3137470 RepID=A0ABQ0DZT9_9PORP